MKREKEAPPSDEIPQAHPPEAKRSKNEAIEAYLGCKYGFRFNTVKCKPEYKAAGDMTFIPITKFALNTFKRELDRELGLTTSADNIRTILESDFSPKVNPVQEYFKNLPRLNPDMNGHIAVLAIR